MKAELLVDTLAYYAAAAMILTDVEKREEASPMRYRLAVTPQTAPRRRRNS